MRGAGSLRRGGTSVLRVRAVVRFTGREGGAVLWISRRRPVRVYGGGVGIPGQQGRRRRLPVAEMSRDRTRASIRSRASRIGLGMLTLLRSALAMPRGAGDTAGA